MGLSTLHPNGRPSRKEHQAAREGLNELVWSGTGNECYPVLVWQMHEAITISTGGPTVHLQQRQTHAGTVGVGKPPL